MKLPAIVAQVIALVVLVWTNCIILFGLNISPRREAALETILNTAATLGYLIFSAVVHHSDEGRAAAQDVAKLQTTTNAAIQKAVGVNPVT